MEGPTILVLNHIYKRQMSHISGIMTCRPTVNGISLGEKLSKLTVQDLEEVESGNNDHLKENTQGLLKAFKTSCKAMGHTDEAVKYARRCCFAMLDHYALNSLFLTITPDNECSFRVRLYAKPCDWVSAFCGRLFYFGRFFFDFHIITLDIFSLFSDMITCMTYHH
jgi:hypothetical protein